MKRFQFGLILASVGASSAAAIAQTSVPVAPLIQGSPQYTGIDLVEGNPGFSIFSKAMESTGVAAIARQSGPYTILAPSDEAFMRMPAGEMNAILGNSDRLRRILQYHVVPDIVMSDHVHNERLIPTQLGDPVVFKRTATGVLTVNGANVTERDIQANNGVVQIIDTVLIPNRRSPADQTRDTTQ